MKDQTESDCVRILEQVSAIEPPPEALERALEQTRQAIIDQPTPATQALPVSLRRGGRRLLRIAAATAAILVVVVGGAFLVLVGPSSATSAFAQVQSAIRKVSYVSCSVEVLEAPEDVIAKSGTSLIDLERNRFRFESADGDDIHVIDGKRGVSLLLFPKQKRAVATHGPSTAPLPSFLNLLDGLRNCDPALVERVTDDVIDSRKFARYRVLPEAPISGGAGILVSVDPETHLPVRIVSTTDTGGGLLRMESSNFSYEQLNPSLFATVPPPGYQVAGDVESPRQALASTAHDLGRSPVEVESWGFGSPQREKLFGFGDQAGFRPDEPAPTLEFRLADTTPSDTFVQSAKLDSGVEIHLHKTPLLTADDIASAKFVGRPNNVTEIQLDIEKNAAARLGAATKQHVGKRLAVMLDGEVIVAPIIWQELSAKASLSGTFSDETLSQLFKALVLGKSHPRDSEPLAPAKEAE